MEIRNEYDKARTKRFDELFKSAFILASIYLVYQIQYYVLGKLLLHKLINGISSWIFVCFIWGGFKCKKKEKFAPFLIWCFALKQFLF
jgi:hypothetical protein